MVCIRDELMVSTTRGHILRYRWDCSQNRDYCLDLRRIPFCIDQQVSKGISETIPKHKKTTHEIYMPTAEIRHGSDPVKCNYNSTKQS